MDIASTGNIKPDKQLVTVTKKVLKNVILFKNGRKKCMMKVNNIY